MRFWRVRFTIGRLMVLVALLAVASALIRVHLSLAALAAGVSSTVFIRTCEKMDRSRAAGRPMGSWEVVESGLDSVVVVVSILGASLLPAVGIMTTWDALLPLGPPRGPLIGDGAIMAVAVSAVLAFPIAVLLRRRMW